MLWVFVPLENFSLMWRRHPCWWRAAHFNLCSVLMVIEQWLLFSMSHLLWNGVSVYDGHLRGPETITIIAERLAVELSLHVFTTEVCRGCDSNTRPSASKFNALTHCATAAVLLLLLWMQIIVAMPSGWDSWKGNQTSYNWIGSVLKRLLIPIDSAALLSFYAIFGYIAMYHFF